MRKLKASTVPITVIAVLFLSSCSSFTPVSYRAYPADGGPNISQALQAGEETLATIRNALGEEIRSLSWREAQHFPQPKPCEDTNAPDGYVTETTSTWIGQFNGSTRSVDWLEIMPAVERVLAQEGFPNWNTAGIQNKDGTVYTVYYGVGGEQLTFTRYTDAVSLILQTGCYRRIGTK